MSQKIDGLAWLPSSPESFKKDCKAVVEEGVSQVVLQRLIQCRHTPNEVNRLHSAIKSSHHINSLKQNFMPVTLGIVSNATTDFILPELFISGLRRGLWIDVIAADFDQALQESLSSDSLMCKAQPDFILVNLDYRAFDFGKQHVAQTEGTAEQAINYLQLIADGFSTRTEASCIFQTLALPSSNLRGSFDFKSTTSIKYQVLEFNRLLDQWLSKGTDYLLDVHSLSSNLGSTNWFDTRQWLNARIPFSDKACSHYTDRVSSLLAAIKGKSRKCLVLDLDNTLWGGVIGDDGLANIAIGEGTAKGEAHTNLQKLALELKSSGTVLAICSKNDYDNAIQPFLSHPDMLLKESDIAVFVANWEDKPANLKYIAETLNIGTDALVFVDDNPLERDIVRSMMPEVSVPELPSDPTMYAEILMAANYFEAVAITEDDIARAEQYRANAKRQQLAGTSKDLQSYLSSLEMEAIPNPINDTSLTRVTQLINKTNQFNLRTQRYTQLQITEMMNSDKFFTLQVRLKDKFGDNGIVSVVICEKQSNTWVIDSWLMSCRVIKRQLEDWVCDYLVASAKASGITRITGTYIPTKKNSLVENLLPEQGFDYNELEKNWQLSLENYQPKNPPINCG